MIKKCKTWIHDSPPFPPSPLEGKLKFVWYPSYPGKVYSSHLYFSSKDISEEFKQ